MPSLTYFSHSFFQVEDGAFRVLIDPFITGNPTVPRSAHALKPTHIVLTHGHGDHLGDALRLAKEHNALIIAVNELANYAAEQGAAAHNMHIGGGYSFPFGRVKFTIAHHGSANHEGRYMGSPAGVVVSIGGKTVYHTGDTGLFLDMQLIGERDAIDVMCLPIGDNFTMGIDDAVKAVEFVQPKIAVPMHYNTFPVIAADPLEFKAKVEAVRRTARVMSYGETIEL